MVKKNSGITLIEMLIVVLIAGMVFGFGGTYFVSYWREHTVAVQKDFLQREARYALDFVIHGTMKQGANGRYFRAAGLIGARSVTILHNGMPALAGEEIMLHDLTGYLGRIVPDPPNKPTRLLFDPDPNDRVINGIEHTIIPIGVSEAPIQGPYEVETWFVRTAQDPSLIEITLTLTQDVRGRSIEARMTSSAMLRNK
ncbi:MAG: PilW family protein [bacterium]